MEINLNRKAFTLFELMVVVMIIGVVYSLVLGSFNPKNSLTITNIQNLKNALSKYWTKNNQVDFYVYDRCSKSILFINGEPKKDIKLDINNKLFKNIKAYKLDRYGSKQLLEFSSVRLEKKIYKSCFKYSIFANGSSSSYVIKNNNKFYTLYPYFEDTKVSKNFDDAFELYKQTELTKITTYE
jgi:prepilin-type N-terminal cleavage/methylation domain-containing protein